MNISDAELIPARILGQDDWLIYGRTADGTLVWTCIETDWHWLEAPHGGSHECGCPEPNMATCRIDNSYMQLYVTQHKSDYVWQRCYVDTDGTRFDWPETDDADFMAQSRATYLCD